MQDPSAPAVRTVVSRRDETPTVRTLEFDDEALAAARPGQFAMVWVPRTGELPMSIMVSDTPGRAAFTVRAHGPASTGLYNTAAGGQIGVRGPFGNSFELGPKKMLLVGGGTGLVPLMRLISQAPRESEITLVMGARTRGEVFFEERAAALGPPGLGIRVATDDGSYGARGTAAEEAARLLKEGGFGRAYTCGPEPMMRGVVDAARAAGVPVQASIERVMKCGIGICGSCSMGGRIVCCEGTVFDGESLAANADFGRAYRSKSGTILRY